MKKVIVKIPRKLLNEIKQDLARKHPFAYERTGFCFGKSIQLPNGNWVAVINEYQSIPDDLYIETDEAAARINSEAIRIAYQKAYTDKVGLFHIHLHELTREFPFFSSIDERSIPEIVKSVQSYSDDQIHGMIVLSQKSINAQLLLPMEKELCKPDQISIVGFNMIFSFPKVNLTSSSTNRYSRQSFLGHKAEDLFSRLKLGIVGLSGGGSHIVQQVAHIGFKNYALSDPEKVDDDSNLNRIVGATLEDAKEMRYKFDVSSKVIKNLHPDSIISGGPKKWEELISDFKDCDIIVGGLDTILGRRDLEAFSRRYLTPYIDIGMGINQEHEGSIMFGQVQVSIPGRACLRCNGFITEKNLEKEANNYGQKTMRPQVVWSNGVLASTAIGVLVEMITNWTGKSPENYYLSYEGHEHTIKDHLAKKYLPKDCVHFPIAESGPLLY